jgi:hypothetical protein
VSKPLLDDSKQLISIATASSLVKNWRVLGRVVNETDLVVTVKWCQEKRVSSSEWELLGVGDLAGAVSTTTAGEDLHCGASCTSGIEAYTSLGLYQMLALLTWPAWG